MCHDSLQSKEKDSSYEGDKKRQKEKHIVKLKVISLHRIYSYHILVTVARYENKTCLLNI